MNARRMATVLAIMLFALLLAPFQAYADTAIGLHLVSHHTAELPDDRGPGWSVTGQQRSAYNERNFGAYVRTDDGMVAGLYRNSYRRLSVHIGHQWDADLPHGWQASLES